MLRARPRIVALLTGAAVLAALVAAPATSAASTLYVGPGGGPGACASPARATIASAVAAASAGDTIHVCAGTYNLAATVVVPVDLSFVGDGAATTIVDGSNGGTPVRLFDAPMLTLSFIGLALRNGSGVPFGGAIFAGAVTVTDSTFSGNSAANAGGAVYAETAANATNSTFSGNSAGSYGGAIYARGAITATSSTFSGNSAPAGNGGAIYGCPVTATNSTFSGNSARTAGAISASGCPATVANATFSGNRATAGNGGAIFTYANVSAARSTFAGNSAAFNGGAIGTTYAVTATDSTFSGNSARAGGVIHANRVTLANSTLSANAATAEGGAVSVYSPGGSPATVTATNSTFSGNSAPDGGAIHSTSGTTLANTIVAGTSGQCAVPGPTDGGGNLVTDASCPGTVTTGAALALGPLASNGGPTQTIALGATSVAIDAGVDATCAAAPVNGVDQRGVARPQGAHCDAGAFERVPTAAPSLVITRVSPGSGKLGSIVTIVGTGFTFVDSVTFNGVVATYSIRSPSLIVTTVPVGATTGPIRITTRLRLSATSPNRFFVLP